MQIYRMAMVAALAILLFGCASKEDRLAKELTFYHSGVQTDLERLKNHIDAGRIRNATLLERYAEVVMREKPEMASIVKVLAADATTEGPQYQSLVARLNAAGKQIPLASKSGEQAASELANEYRSLGIAADASNFNMMLTDPVNVLADMSGGTLARVADMSQDAAKAASAPGAELVGNPGYGQWRTNSSGGTFWEWYGKYALFSNLFGGPIGYSSWSSSRPPSYYHDVGREHYSSPAQKQRYQSTEQRVKKQFTQSGRTFQSPYANRTAATASLSTPSKYSRTRFNSQYANSRSSSYNSRSGSGSGSRSYGSGGK